MNNKMKTTGISRRAGASNLIQIPKTITEQVLGKSSIEDIWFEFFTDSEGSIILRPLDDISGGSKEDMNALVTKLFTTETPEK